MLFGGNLESNLDKRVKGLNSLFGKIRLRFKPQLIHT